MAHPCCICESVFRIAARCRSIVVVVDSSMRLLLLSLDDYTTVYSVVAGLQGVNGTYLYTNIFLYIGTYVCT